MQLAGFLVILFLGIAVCSIFSFSICDRLEEKLSKYMFGTLISFGVWVVAMYCLVQLFIWILPEMQAFGTANGTPYDGFIAAIAVVFGGWLYKKIPNWFAL